MSICTNYEFNGFKQLSNTVKGKNYNSTRIRQIHLYIQCVPLYSKAFEKKTHTMENLERDFKNVDF